MSVLRRTLLRASQSKWLAQQASRRTFARQAVLRFMPGEEVDSAIRAAVKLGSQGVTTVLTQLGEDIADRSEAAAVTAHYLDVMDRIKERSLRTHISVKLTQLGLDIDREFCFQQVRRLTQKASEVGNVLWVDMEGSPLVDATIDIYQAVRSEHPNVGLCLQAYLHRTPDDLEALIAAGARIRLVKGAYREPPEVAIAKKSDVDAQFLKLAMRLLKPDSTRGSTPHGMATHDMRLITAIQQHARSRGIPTEAFEFQMLYGIRTEDQLRLAAAGFKTRTLISYGSAWFPWYMRRLAERPANLWFVVKSLLG